MATDYRRTPYDKECPDFKENKKRLEKIIKKDHPRAVDLHRQVSAKDGSYKLAFIEAYDGRCAYCGASIRFIHKNQFEIDHYIPYTDRSRFESKKDAGYMDNLVLSCYECNRSKHDYRIPDNYLNMLHPDNKEIKDIFQRSPDYYIRVNEDYNSDSEILNFYNKLDLGAEMHRLDYLLLNMIGIRDANKDDDRLSKLESIIQMLTEKRNIGLK